MFPNTVVLVLELWTGVQHGVSFDGGLFTDSFSGGFETAWRLSDTYDFKDEWRLTVKQIDQYNAILEESDAAWRYAKLEQYQSNFFAYPYYWYELAEAAFQASQVDPENKPTYLIRAEKALNTFIETDMQLLRQDIISASAILRLVQLLQQKNKSWDIALKETKNQLFSVIKLACDAPDLLMNAALCYAAAYEESSDKKYADYSIKLLEMLVNRNYNQPTTSRLLSKLYLMTNMESEYSILKNRVGEDWVWKNEKSLSHMIKPDRQKLLAECEILLYRQFLVALKISCPEIYNVNQDEINSRLTSWLEEKNSRLDSTVQEDMRIFWDKLKIEINTQMTVLCNLIGIDQQLIVKVARELSSIVEDKINKYSGTWVDKHLSSTNRIIEQQIAFNSLTELIRSEFTSKFAELIEQTFSSGQYADISILEGAVGGLREYLAKIIDRNGIIGAKEIEQQPASLNFFIAEVSECDQKCTSEKIKKDPLLIESWIKGNQSFEIINLSITELFSIANKIEKLLVHSGKKVRVYTASRSAIATALMCSPASLIGGGMHVVNAVHNLITFDPDYEIVRYPTRLVIKYKRKQ